MRNLMILMLLTGFSATFSACATNALQDDQAGVDDLDGKEDSNRTTAYYLARPDLRRCIFPYCGGIWVHRVNFATTRCADGSAQAECYVAASDVSALKLSEAESTDLTGALEGGKAVVRGSVKIGDVGGFNVGRLVVTKAWRSATETAPMDGDRFYRLTDANIRCIRAPCPTIRETKLNTTTAKIVYDLTFEGADATDDQKEAASAAIFNGLGLVVAGINFGQPVKLDASQIYLPVAHKVDFYSCERDSDCQKIFDGCCPYGPEVAVRNGTAEEYHAAKGCKQSNICLAIATLKTDNMAECNSDKKCELVKPGDILCGAHSVNSHACPENYLCAGPNLASDGGGGCYKTCGGIAARPCQEEGYSCNDNPWDDCDPNHGGADCGGLCQSQIN